MTSDMTVKSIRPKRNDILVRFWSTALSILSSPSSCEQPQIPRSNVGNVACERKVAQVSAILNKGTQRL